MWFKETVNTCMAGMGKDKAERGRENVGVTTENYRNDNTGLFHVTEGCY